jgi:uncharacterized protein (DUF2235 family)
MARKGSNAGKLAGKNIVVFSDGTGQEGGAGNNTNVYKLFQMIEDRTPEQIAFYDAGIGTGWRKVSAAVGMGITKNIFECYQFISDNYQWGDRIFLFGFSRGASTVRSLSGFIARFGILPSSRPDLIEKAWKIYKIKDEGQRERRAVDFLNRNVTTWANIDFLGVWDTVVALGLPIKLLDGVLNRIPWFQHSHHDLRLSPCVHHAYHALSIDEDRKTFRPTIWQTELGGESELGEVYFDPRDGDEGEQTAKDRKQTVKQVWFCGVHTDVGGGYRETGVSDISLVWMLERARDASVLEHPLRVFPYHSVTVEQNIEDAIHSERQTTWDQLIYPEGLRQWDASKGGKLILHASVLERKRGKAGGDNLAYKASVFDTASGRDLIEAGEYEVEPWDEKLPLYGIPIEIGYRSNRTPGFEA